MLIRRAGRGLQRRKNFPLNIRCYQPPLSRFLHLLVGKLLGAGGDEITILQGKFVEDRVEGLNAMLAGGLFVAHTELIREDFGDGVHDTLFSSCFERA